MNITTIVEAAFTLIAVVVTAAVVPYIKSRTTAKQQAELSAWVKIAVTAAEQIFTGTGLGRNKKEYVQRWLTAHGFTVDTDKIDTMIESAVYAMKSGNL